MNLKNKSGVEKISEHYEALYKDDLIRVSEIIGELIGQGDWTGLRWFLEGLAIASSKALEVSAEILKKPGSKVH